MKKHSRLEIVPVRWEDIVSIVKAYAIILQNEPRMNDPTNSTSLITVDRETDQNSQLN